MQTTKRASRATVLIGLCLGALVTVTLASTPVDVPVALVGSAIVLCMVMLATRYLEATRDHRDLQAVHGFAHAVNASLDVADIARRAVVEFGRLLGTDEVNLVIFDDESCRSLARAGLTVHDVPTSNVDERWTPVLAARQAARRSLIGGVWQDTHTRAEVIAVPIVVDGRVAAVVLAHDQLGSQRLRGTSDLRMADAFAEALSSALANAFRHAQVTHAASHDVLTGNRNRASFEEAICEVLDVEHVGFGADEGSAISDPGDDGCTAVFMIDLNRFKEINDTLGHHVGDRVLVEFATRLRAQLCDDDVSARFGGDEFAVLIRRDTLHQVTAVAKQIEAATVEPMRLDSLDVVVTASIGIAVLDHGSRDAAEVLRRADVAMYLAKRSSVSAELYRPEIDRRTPERLSMLADIRKALDASELEVHYQPQVDLVTDAVLGAEALVRWTRPGYGPVDPVELIRVAEESGVIKQVTDYVLDRALSTTRRWRDDGYLLGIAINLSTHDLLDDQLPTRVERALTAHGVSPERLTLEITERALLMDAPRTLSTLQRLGRLGVRLSLDDFGTGYSSLGYLRRLPVNELKVDHSFVKNLLLEEHDALIVRSTIELSHNLGLQVVAEGVENGLTLDRLKEIGCDIGQGYGISRPLPPQMFSTWIRTTGHHVTRCKSTSVGV